MIEMREMIRRSEERTSLSLCSGYMEELGPELVLRVGNTIIIMIS